MEDLNVQTPPLPAIVTKVLPCESLKVRDFYSVIANRSKPAIRAAPRFSSRMIRPNPIRRSASDIAETKMLLARLG
ncbi:MAG: hypothetical protein WCN98_14995 [Verrucomicrobiaceae bacterium]